MGQTGQGRMWSEPGGIDGACPKPPEEEDARQMMSRWRAPRDRGTQAAQPAGALAFLLHGGVDMGL